MKKYLFVIGLILFVNSVANAKLREVATLGADTPPGNIAVGPDGRIFVSVHQFYGQPFKVVEVLADGKARPYPNHDWSDAANMHPLLLNGVLGLNVDRRGILWMLDGTSEQNSGKLIGWNTKNETLEKVIYLAPPATIKESFLNDLAIDRTHNYAYIVDPASPGNSAFIIVNLNTGETRRVLHGVKLLQAEDTDIIVDGKLVELGGQPARIGLNPITLSADNRHLYFGSMSGTHLYRIETVHLRESSLSDEEIAAEIETYASKPISDGITIDSAGNIYITELNSNAIGVIDSTRNYRRLYKSKDISWPDGFAIGPGNDIFLTVNELHNSPVLNDGLNKSSGNFKILAFPSLADSVIGR